VSAETNPSTSAPAPSRPDHSFGRTALAILATMLILIVALTSILVETTWRQPSGTIEVPGDPGSFAHR
jgi:hypothetical protein